jgi:hypothetical protein
MGGGSWRKRREKETAKLCCGRLIIIENTALSPFTLASSVRRVELAKQKDAIPAIIPVVADGDDPQCFRPQRWALQRRGRQRARLLKSAYFLVLPANRSSDNCTFSGLHGLGSYPSSRTWSACRSKHQAAPSKIHNNPD